MANDFDSNDSPDSRGTQGPGGHEPSEHFVGKIWREAWGIARTVDFLPP